jgi:hypothetical protein
MAQNALTVTAANPTPPTNLSFVGNTPSLDWLQPFADDGISKSLPNATTPGSDVSTINEDKASTTWPVSITFATSTAATNTAPASSGSAINGGQGISNTHEARGTETSSTAASGNPNALGQLKMVGVGPALSAAIIAAGPNASHASSLSPTTPLTPTTIATPSGVNNVANGLATVLTVPGTNFNRTSVVNINGVPQTTNYVSTASLTVTNAVKRTSAGTYPITVTNTNSGLTSNATNWTMT